MKTKILLAGVLIILKLSFLGCAVGTVATVESGDRATEQSRVLIATQKEKLIVLTTGRLDSWKLESPRVDAITSASVMTQAATIGQSLAGKALKIIRSQQNI